MACTALSKLPKIGEVLVILRDSRFIDLDGEEGTLKVPAGDLPPGARIALKAAMGRVPEPWGRAVGCLY